MTGTSITTQVTRQTELPSPTDDEVLAAVTAACDVADLASAAIHVVFCDDEEIAGVHGEFFDDPTATDVITFPIEGDGSAAFPRAGELLISVETAATVAAGDEHSAVEEALLYVIHGTLHLAGLDDQTPEKRAEMRAAERVALQTIGVALHYFE